MRVAAIDIGTVTSRLLVADVDASGTRQVAAKAPSRIWAKGSMPQANFCPKRSIARLLRSLSTARLLMHGAADCVVALATSASRDARNSGVFVSRLHEVGVELSVIPGEREAALSFLGASNDFRNEDLLFGRYRWRFDRDGILVEANGSAGDLVPDVAVQASHSFNIGCRRMTERFLAGDRRRKASLLRLRHGRTRLSRRFSKRAIRTTVLLRLRGHPRVWWPCETLWCPMTRRRFTALA